ncbi:4266_t:CDS:2 [Paraglomus brasilianum]|uniref:4266_t:CDS:1 n=1 Tax=Paraglomus brasilianum TaxID=144538 RepID=A0A9N9FG94_9GLOM|nr:4266_t:CDS:2 [Paraglomus brasilianum]
MSAEVAAATLEELKEQLEQGQYSLLKDIRQFGNNLLPFCLRKKAVIIINNPIMVGGVVGVRPIGRRPTTKKKQAIEND